MSIAIIDYYSCNITSIYSAVYSLGAKVEVVHNDIATTEQAGIDFLKEIHKDPTGIYVQTSYNNNFREKFSNILYKNEITKYFIYLLFLLLLMELYLSNVKSSKSS